MNLELAKQTFAEAQAALAAADHELDELRTRLDGLASDLATEKTTVRDLERDAIEGRAAGKTVKTAAIDNARGAVRITEGAIEVVQRQIEAGRAKRADLHTAATAAEKSVAAIHAGALLLEVAPIAAELLRRVDAADPRGHFGLLAKFTDVVGGVRLPGDVGPAQRRLASFALDVLHGTGSDERRAAEPLPSRLALPDDVAAVLPVPGEPRLLEMIAAPGPAVRLVA